MTTRWIFALSCVTLTACNYEVVRRSETFERINQEIAAAAAPKGRAAEAARNDADALSLAMLPPLQLEIPAAPPPEPRFDMAVSNASVTQVLTALVTGTRYSMLFSPDVSGTVSLNLKNTTVREVLETLRELYGYDFTIQGQRISVLPNTVQSRIFRINYLAGERSGRSVTRVPAPSAGPTTQGQGARTAGQGAAGGSDCEGSSGGAADSACVSTRSKYDFWGALTEALEKLVTDKNNLIVNPLSGVIVVKGTPLELRKVDDYLKATQLSVERQVMLEAKIIEVELGDDFNSGINWASFNKKGDPRWSVNGNTDVFRRGGGVTSTASQTMNLQDSLGSTANSAAGAFTSGNSRQSDTSVTSNVTTNYDSAAAVSGLAMTGVGGLLKSFPVQGALGLAFQSANFSSLISFLQTQGTVYVLSSPRIATLNNQKAVLKVGSEDRFVVEIQPPTSTSTGANNGTTSNPPTVITSPFFSGIALDVTPQIDDQGNITLHMRPSVTSVTERAKTIDFGASGQFTIPYASSKVKESDSIVRVRDGMIVAIGGLMSESQSGSVDKVPELGDIPLFGHLFKQTGRSMRKRELVILLKPTLIQDDADWQQMTQEMQNRMPAFDPRTQPRPEWK
jgi:MSHA biogenesis protein MshL